MQPLLLLLAFLLPSEPATGIIMGGHEAKPHSHPYMAWIQIMDEEMPSRCGGVLVQEDFVLTAAHCWGSSVKVTLGAHNIKKQERTQQVISVIETIPHPHYNPKKFSNDIMLLKLERKAKGHADCSCEAPQPAQGPGPGEARRGMPSSRLGASQPKRQIVRHSAGGGADCAAGSGVQIPVRQLLQQYHSAVRGGPEGKEVFL
nr:PREDICTED: granzyme B-like isoform X2 [Equus przewalskii]